MVDSETHLDKGRDDGATPGGGKWRGKRCRWRIVVAIVLLLLIAAGSVVGYVVARRHVAEQRAIRRLEALDARLDRKAMLPPWLDRFLLRFTMSRPRWLSAVNGVNPEFGDSDLALLRHCCRIHALDLDRTGVTDEGLVHLAGLKELDTLSLSGTGVTDAGLAHLKHLTNLELLTLRDTKVTDAGVAHLTPLRNLLRLDLRGTQVTVVGIARLKQALPNADARGP